MLSLKAIHKIIRIILIAIPILVFVWLLDKNFVFSGHLESVYNFEKNNPIISILKPAGRALGVERDESGDYSQAIIIDPVYFDLYLPTKFKKAKLIFTYKAPEKQKIKVGPQILGEGWNYYLLDLNCKERISGWCISALQFDLTRAFVKNRKLNFMISAPGLDKSGKEIVITEIRAVLGK